MTGAREVGVALVLSLGLHVGLAAGLRAIGLGPGAEVLPPLFVDLVEPVVARPQPSPPPPPLTRRAPAPAPAREPVVTPSRPEPRPAPAPTAEPPAVAETGPAPPTIAAPPTPPLPSEPVPAPSVPAPLPSENAPATPSVGAATGATPAPAPEAAPGTPLPEPIGPPGAGSGTGVPASAVEGPAEAPVAAGAGRAPTPAGAPADVASLPGDRAGSVPPEYDAYVQTLRRRIQERLAYPWVAVRRGLQGTIELEVRIDAGGRLAGVATIGADGAAILRDAATRAVQDAAPFPFPPGLAARALTIRLPVVFQLK